MEYDGEILGRQTWGFQEAVDDGWITEWHEITTIELLVRELQNRFMRSEIFDKLDDT